MGKQHKDTRHRPWVKLRLPDNKDARYADKILARWRLARTASTFLARAVRVYDALLRGDKDDFNDLIKEYFPGYGLVIGTAEVLITEDGGTESKVRTPAVSRPKLPKAKIVVRAEAHNNGNDDDDDVGFGTLNIGD